MSRATVVRLLQSRSPAIIHAAAFGSGCHPLWVGKYSRSPLVNTNFISTQFPIFQKRWASHASKTEDDSKLSIGPHKDGERSGGEKETGVVYYGPISSTIKKVKLLSLSTCCLSVSLGPVITFMTSPDLNVILKGAVAASVIFFSATTTGALHWFVSPYIHKLKWQPGSDTFEVEMMTWLATYTPRTLKFSDIRIAETQRPYVSFMANGDYYYIDPEHCHNKALMARLTPQKVTQESAFKNI